MDISWLGNGAEALVKIAGAITAIGVITIALRKSMKWFKLQKERFDWLEEDRKDHAFIKENLEAIRMELTQNGGSGTIKDAVCDIRDILEFNGAYMRTLMHTSDKPMFETNGDGHVTHVNRAYIRLLGVSSHEVASMGWVNVINPKYREDIVDKWFTCVRGKHAFDEDVPLQHSNGKKFNTHVLAHVIRVGNKVKGYIGEIQEIN